MTAFPFSRLHFPLPRAHPRRTRLPSQLHSPTPPVRTASFNPNRVSTPGIDQPTSVPTVFTSYSTCSASSDGVTCQSDPSPDIATLWRDAHHILPKLSVHSHVRAFESALNPYLQARPNNPFLWHSLLSRLATHHGYDHPLLRDVLARALSHVRVGQRGILVHFHASLHIHRGALPAALRLLTDSLSTEARTHAPLYTLLASVHARLDDPSAARAVFRAAVQAFPRHAGMWRAWARFEASQGARHQALSHCRQALDADPTNPRAWRMLLQLLRTFRAGSAHISDVLHEALASCPRDPGLRLHLARLEERRKGARAALSVLSCLENSPHPDVLRTLARLHFHLGDVLRARRLFRTAAGPPPALAADLDLSSVSASGSGSASGSASGFASMLAATSTTFTTVTNATTSTTASTHTQTQPTRRRHSRQHKSVKALHTWALMEAKVGNVDEARSLLTEARSLCQTDAGIWRAIAELESRERNFDLARKAFRNAVAINPNDPRVFFAWSRTETLAGNPTKSEELMEKADSLSEQRKRSSSNSNKNDFDSGPVPVFIDNDDSDTESEMGNQDKSPDDDDFSGSRNISLTPHLLAGALRERAMLASRDGRFEDSVRLLTRASQMEPGNEVGWRLLASQEVRRSGIERLRHVYRTGLKHVVAPSKAKLLHWWGQDERANENMAEARELFRKSTLANPYYMSAWMSWGLLEKSLGDVGEACKILESATKLAEEDVIRAPYIFLTWGRIEEMDRKNADRAASIFERGVKLAPSSGALWAAWALLECNRGNWEAARVLFQKATQADPKYGNGWHQWALMEAGRCNFKSAIELFEAGYEHDKNDASIIAAWATMEGNDLDNVARGRDLFQRAVDIDSMFVDGWLAWGNMEVAAGNINQGRDLFKRASMATGENAAALQALGKLEWEHGNRPDLAAKYFAQASKLGDTVFAALYESWALMLEGQDDAERAEALLRESMGKCGTGQEEALGILLNALGRLKLRSGARKQARELGQKSLQMWRRRWEGWIFMSDVEYDEGKKEAAVDVLKEGVQACVGTRCGKLYQRMGEILVELEQIDEMRTMMRQGISHTPSDRALWSAFAKLERQAGSAANAQSIESKSKQVFMRSSDSEKEALSA